MTRMEAALSGQRSVERIPKMAAVQFYIRWPQIRPYEGIVTDLSPNGLGLRAAVPAQPESVIKLDSPVLQAIAQVVTCAPASDGAHASYRLGLNFLTAEFRSLEGNFVSARV